MKILLTGSTGMLGRAILRCADTDIAIKAMIRDRDQIPDLDESCPVTNTREYAVADLQNPESLNEACRGVDVVVHSAALSSPWGRAEDFECINVQGTRHLLKAAEAQGVEQFVFVSSPSIYFDFKNASCICEDHALPDRFCNDYARSKVKAESLVNESELSTTILRPRGIFGPHDRAIVPRLLGAIKNKTLVLPSERNPYIDMTYVDNVAMAVINAIHVDNAQGVFNITNDQPMRLFALLKMLVDQVAPGTQIKTLPYGLMSRVAAVSELCCRWMPGYPEPRLTRYSAGLFHFDQSLCIDEAVNKLDYQPAISIEEGVRRYAQWYRKSIKQGAA